MPVGVMPGGTRPYHTRKYEPLYALALPAVNPCLNAQSILLEWERAIVNGTDDFDTIWRNTIDEGLSSNIG